MPKRQAIITVPSEDVQGEDSFVKLRTMTWGQAKRLRAMRNGMGEDEQTQATDDLLIKHVYEWNWVDDEGKALPLPKDDPGVLDDMTVQEITFLAEALGGGQEEEKN